jgi:hypothetical protein
MSTTLKQFMYSEDISQSDIFTFKTQEKVKYANEKSSANRRSGPNSLEPLFAVFFP